MSMRSMREDESGSIAVMVAFIVFAVFAATALAVDIGRVGYTSRDLQGATDRAALDAIQVVAAGGVADLATLHKNAVTAVKGSMARNIGTSNGTARDRDYVVALGMMDGTTFTAICDGNSDTPAPSCGMASGFTVADVTALRVDSTSIVDFIFAIPNGASEDSGQRVVHRTSVAATEEVGVISVGSRLVEVDLNDSLVRTVVDELMGAMLRHVGVTEWPGLTAAGYDGLVNTTIPLGDLANLDAALLSPRSLVPSVEVGLADLLSIMGSAFSAGDPSATLLAELANGVAAADATAGTPATVDIGQLLWVTTEDDGVAAEAEITIWDLLLGTLQVANLDHGLELSMDSGSGGLLGMASLFDLSLTATVVEAPRIAIGPVRPAAVDLDGDGVDEDWWVTRASTAQVNLDLALGVGEDPASVFGPHVGSLLGDLLDGLLGLIGDILCLFCPDPDPAPVHVSVHGARAFAGLSGVACPGSSLTTDVMRRPVDLGQLTVDGDTRQLYVGLLDVLEAELGVSGLSLAPTGSRESVTIDPVPGSGTVGTEAPTTIPMLDAILKPALALLGVDLGTATVWAHGVDCESRRLAYITPEPAVEASPEG